MSSKQTMIAPAYLNPLPLTPPDWRELSHDPFLRGYVNTLLWAGSVCDEDGNHVSPEERGYSPDDIHINTLQNMDDDCHQFLLYVRENFGPEVAEELDGDLERAGGDFFLTRCRHGAGFWDGDYDHGQALTRAAQTFGDVNLYPGEDAMLHQQ